MSPLVVSNERNSLPVSHLSTSFDISLTLRKIKQCTKLQFVIYSSLLVNFAYCFILVDLSAVFKVYIVFLSLPILLLPVTSQFVTPSLPILNWLILFQSYSKVFPQDKRPPITTNILPCVEFWNYGLQLSEVLSSYHNTTLDLLAWVVYGVLHYVSPVLVAFLVFVFGPPTSLPCFALCFGCLSYFGVMVQILLPCVPPWYKLLYGTALPNYEIRGYAAGLKRIDELFGVEFYTRSFENSPIVFGAFPSLHSGWAVMNVLFVTWLFPKSTRYVVFYIIWLWWATMYFQHHFFIDLIFGGFVSLSLFTLCKYYLLPQVIRYNITRWDYNGFKIGHIHHNPESGMLLPIYECVFGTSGYSSIDSTLQYDEQIIDSSSSISA